MPKNYKKINRSNLSDNVAGLYYHAYNDYGTAWPRRPESIRKNQLNKVKNGTYDFDKSIKMQRYRVDDAWKFLKKEGREGWRTMSVADKNEAATLLAEDFYDDIGYELFNDIKKELGKNLKTPEDVIKYYQFLRQQKQMKKSKPKQFRR